MAIKINNNTIINDNKGIVDKNNNVGIANSVLTSDGTSIEWKPPGGSATLNVVTSNITLEDGKAYMINASNTVLTLPSSPSTGNSIDIYNNIAGIHTLSRNGSTIMSIAEDMQFGESGLKFKIWYTGSTWSLF
jgi:hypothetical protein